MTPEELREAGAELYGSWGWQTRLAERLQVNSSTVRRWVSGNIPIPGPVAAALECFLREKRQSSETSARSVGEPFTGQTETD